VGCEERREGVAALRGPDVAVEQFVGLATARLVSSHVTRPITSPGFFDTPASLRLRFNPHLHYLISSFLRHNLSLTQQYQEEDL